MFSQISLSIEWKKVVFIWKTPFGLSNLIRDGCSWVQEPADHGLGTLGWGVMISFDLQIQTTSFSVNPNNIWSVIFQGLSLKQAISSQNWFLIKHCTMSPKVHVVQSCLPKGCLVHQTRRIFGAHGSRPTTVAVTRLRSTATLSLGVVGNGGVVLEGG